MNLKNYFDNIKICKAQKIEFEDILGMLKRIEPYIPL
jgi:hypothetical protein